MCLAGGLGGFGVRAATGGILSGESKKKAAAPAPVVSASVSEAQAAGKTLANGATVNTAQQAAIAKTAKNDNPVLVNGSSM